MTTDRRTVLGAAGLASVALGTGALTSGCSAPASSSSGGAPAPGALAVPADSIPVGGGRIIDNSNFVVTQPTAGEFKAFNKTCTHQGCPVSAVQNGEIECRCHGARFSIKDGSVTNGPANKPLKPAKAVLDGKDVKVSA